MANDEGMTKIERQNKMHFAPLLFEHSGLHSSFVIRALSFEFPVVFRAFRGQKNMAW
jgi:hypothetical protein